MKKISSAFFLALSLSGYAQNEDTIYKYSVKLYNLSSYHAHNWGTSPNFLNQQFFQIINPTIAFQWKSGEDYQEVELTNFVVSASLFESNSPLFVNNNGTFTQSNISLRYEYILTLIKEKRLMMNLGVSVAPFYNKRRFIPNVSTAFGAANTNIGLNTFLIPRMVYNCNKKVYIDFNIPVSLSDVSLQSNFQDNPAMPVSLRRTTTFNYEKFPKIFFARIGIGIRI